MAAFLYKLLSIDTVTDQSHEGQTFVLKCKKYSQRICDFPPHSFRVRLNLKLLQRPPLLAEGEEGCCHGYQSVFIHTDHREGEPRRRNRRERKKRYKRKRGWWWWWWRKTRGNRDNSEFNKERRIAKRRRRRSRRSLLECKMNRVQGEAGAVGEWERKSLSLLGTNSGWIALSVWNVLQVMKWAGHSGGVRIPVTWWVVDSSATERSHNRSKWTTNQQFVQRCK